MGYLIVLVAIYAMLSEQGGKVDICKDIV